MNIEHLLKALANRRRLTILRALQRTHELTVADMAHEIKLSFKATSKHLLILARVEVVGRRQVGLQVYYSLSKPSHPVVTKLLTFL